MIIPFFLDSGAFSAKNQGIEIDLRNYIRFIKENEDVITTYANLDVIGDAEASWRNQRRMENAGLNPLPVFHVEDDMKYLDRCLEYEHFCLGGMAKGYTTSQREAFLHRCWCRICDTPDQMPKSKVHGFGMTALPLIKRYPWYSVDSTTWLMLAANGNVLVPKFRKGEFQYGDIPHIVAVSSRSKDVNVPGSMHVDTFPPMAKKQILDYFEMRGFSYEEIQTNYVTRGDVTMTFLYEFSRHLPAWPWPFKTRRREGLLI